MKRMTKDERELIKNLFGESEGYKTLKRQARRRDKYFSISPGFYDSIIEKGCFYCGDSLDKQKGVRVDRVDNKGHYTKENVVGCCKHCNFAKRTMSTDEFLTWIQKVFGNIGRIKRELPLLKFNEDNL